MALRRFRTSDVSCSAYLRGGIGRLQSRQIGEKRRNRIAADQRQRAGETGDRRRIDLGPERLHVVHRIGPRPDVIDGTSGSAATYGVCPRKPRTFRLNSAARNCPASFLSRMSSREITDSTSRVFFHTAAGLDSRPSPVQTALSPFHLPSRAEEQSDVAICASVDVGQLAALVCRFRIGICTERFARGSGNRRGATRPSARLSFAATKRSSHKLEQSKRARNGGGSLPCE